MFYINLQKVTSPSMLWEVFESVEGEVCHLSIPNTNNKINGDMMNALIDVCMILTLLLSAS